MAREKGVKLGVLKLCNVWPVPEKALRELAVSVGKIFAVEMNNGKYVNEIARCAEGKCPVLPVTKNRGLAHTSREIFEAVMEGVKAK